MNKLQMKPIEAKQIIKKLGLTGVKFSKLMNKNTNYVTDFNRYGVPANIAIILALCDELINQNVTNKKIIEILTNQGKTLDNESE